MTPLRNGNGLELRVAAAVGAHPAVANVRLTGSRAAGRAGPRSDWDFLVEAMPFDALADALPRLLEPLGPVAVQWDRLSDVACYMALLPGPVKVDLIFPAVPHEHEPPWQASAETLEGIDVHFWDWALWLAGKDAAGRKELVARELVKLHEHLLGPLDAPRAPRNVADAVALYRVARARAEQRFGTEVPRSVEDTVAPAIST